MCLNCSRRVERSLPRNAKANASFNRSLIYSFDLFSPSFFSYVMTMATSLSLGDLSRVNNRPINRGRGEERRETSSLRSKRQASLSALSTLVGKKTNSTSLYDAAIMYTTHAHTHAHITCIFTRIPSYSSFLARRRSYPICRGREGWVYSSLPLPASLSRPGMDGMDYHRGRRAREEESS